MTTKEIIQYVKNHPSGKVKIAIADINKYKDKLRAGLSVFVTIETK